MLWFVHMSENFSFAQFVLRRMGESKGKVPINGNISASTVKETLRLIVESSNARNY